MQVGRLVAAIEANEPALEAGGAVIEAKPLRWGDRAAALEVAPFGSVFVRRVAPYSI